MVSAATLISTYVVKIRVFAVDVVRMRDFPVLSWVQEVGVDGVMFFDFVVIGGTLWLSAAVAFGGDSVGQFFGHHFVPVLVFEKLWILCMHLIDDHVRCLESEFICH